MRQAQVTNRLTKRITYKGRRTFISGALYKFAKGMMPKISDTERAALNAGTVGFDRNIFSGRGLLYSQTHSTLRLLIYCFLLSSHYSFSSGTFSLYLKAILRLPTSLNTRSLSSLQMSKPLWTRRSKNCASLWMTIKSPKTETFQRSFGTDVRSKDFSV